MVQLPQIGDEYDAPQQRALAREIERALNNDKRKPLSPQLSDAEETDFDPTKDILLTTRSGTGTGTINLPTVADMVGRLIYIKDAGLNASGNIQTIDAAGSEEIDGATTYGMTTDGACVGLYSDGADWYIVFTAML